MTEQTEISAILGGTAESQPVADKVEVQTPAIEQPNTPGEPAKAAQDGTPPPQKPEDLQAKAFAEMSRKIKTLEHQLRTAAQPKPEPQALDPIMDPDGFTKAIQEQVQATAIKARLDTSELIFSQSKPDYLDTIAEFQSLIIDDPSLYQRMIDAQNPAEFAYNYTKQAKLRAEIGDPVQYTEKVRSEERQRVLAELPNLVQAELKKALAGILPSSLASEQTSAGRVTNPEGWSGPTPLSDILKR